MEMKNRLINLLEESYAPYSGFRVSAIVIDINGNEYEGVNVESSSFGATQCAERNAINSAVTKGMKKGELKEVHLIAKNKNGELIPAAPCGICRQVILEQSNANAKIFRYDNEGIKIENTIEELLPDGFSGEDL
jgi:cytidine deaminase